MGEGGGGGASRRRICCALGREELPADETETFASEGTDDLSWKGYGGGRGEGDLVSTLLIRFHSPSVANKRLFRHLYGRRRRLLATIGDGRHLASNKGNDDCLRRGVPA